MPLELHELTSSSPTTAFPRLMSALMSAYATPYDGFWRIYTGFTPTEECIARFDDWRKRDPTARWVYVTDTETGEVVGATQWNFVLEDSPYPDSLERPLPRMRADWLKEGSTLRILSEAALNTFFAHRPRYMNRPHFLVRWCATIPTHRRGGIGRRMLQWGTDRADALGVSCFVEAAERVGAVPMYRVAGFVPAEEFVFDAEHPQRQNDEEEWQWWRRELEMPMRGWVMWRPVGGRWVEGTTRFPWVGEGERSRNRGGEGGREGERGEEGGH